MKIPQRYRELIVVYFKVWAVGNVFIWGVYFIVHGQLTVGYFFTLCLWLFLWSCGAIIYHAWSVDRELSKLYERARPFIGVVKNLADLMDAQEKTEVVNKEEKS